MIRRPPISTRFPYPTLFRSLIPAVSRRQDLGDRRLPRLGDQIQRPRLRRLHAVELARHRHRLAVRSEEHTSELQSRQYLVCRLLLEKKHMTLIYLLTDYARF